VDISLRWSCFLPFLGMYLARCLLVRSEVSLPLDSMHSFLVEEYHFSIKHLNCEAIVSQKDLLDICKLNSPSRLWILGEVGSRLVRLKPITVQSPQPVFTLP